MHSFHGSANRIYETFPEPDAVQRRAARPGPPVRAEDVPAALRTVPGAIRDRATERFYDRHYPEPNFKTGDLNLTYHRVVTAGPSAVGETYRLLGEKYGDLIPRLNQAAQTYHERPALAEPDGRDLTDEARAKAKECGADLVGFTSFDRKYVTAETREKAQFSNVIVLCRAFDYELTQAVPSIDWDVHSYDTSIAITLAALKLADWIREQGWQVQFMAGTGIPGETMIAPIVPYAVAAGLGQLGANGTMLTPEYGSRLRVLGLSTDAPLRHDKPRDFGINALCDECKVCISRCPGRAISRDRINWRGVSKYKIVADRCLPVLRWAECNLCTRVCPVQRWGLKPVLDHFRETGQVLGKGTDELEAYEFMEKGRFGPGELPKLAPEEGGRGIKQMAKRMGVA